MEGCRRHVGVAMLVAFCLGACAAPPAAPPVAEAESAQLHFREIQAEAGVAFRHLHGGTGERYMPETMGSGGGWLDADGDGRLDLYLVQSGAFPGTSDAAEAGERPANQLFRNRGDGTFANVTVASGTGDSGYGMGTCFGDVDNDGHVDIYVTQYGPDVLFHNRGDGTFENWSAALESPLVGWSTSCAFADYDRDGWLDLYVVRYVAFHLGNHRDCGPPVLPQYCHPDVYDGVSDVLLHNLGPGADGRVRFADVSQQAGVLVADPSEGKGLGVLWSDFDDDGWIDIYVSNDSTRNFLYHNQGDGTFREIGALAGVAYNELGATEAGMGVDAGDVDGDGRFDLVITNLDFETNTLYRNLGDGLFEDATTLSGLGPASLERVGFGALLFDVENDGDLDLYVANGHILDNVAESNPTLSYAQPDQLFLNDGHGRFTDVSTRLAEPFAVARVSRGAAAADFDDDGDLDLLLTHCNDEAVLLRNGLAAGGHWLGLRLLSRHGGRDAVGARVRLVAAGRAWVAEVRSGASYLSQSDPRLLFGLGEIAAVERLEVRWPEGESETIPGTSLVIDAYNEIRQAAP